MLHFGSFYSFLFAFLYYGALLTEETQEQFGLRGIRDELNLDDNQGIIKETSDLNICSKYGCNCDDTQLSCYDVNPNDILDQNFFDLFPHIRTINFVDCNQKSLNFDIFANATSLREISIRNCNVKELIWSSSSWQQLNYLKRLKLSNNYISNWDQICNLLSKVPLLDYLDISMNYLNYINDDGRIPSTLRYLNASNNKVSNVQGIPSVEVLDLSSNHISAVNGIWPSSLRFLNLSINPTLKLVPSFFESNLTHINVDACELSNLTFGKSKSLKYLSAKQTAIEYVDFTNSEMDVLQELDLSDNRRLSSILGELPKMVKIFRLTNSQISYFPLTFFQSVKELRKLDLDGNRWLCNECIIGWISYLPFKFKPAINCSRVHHPNCSIGLSSALNDRKRIIRARMGEWAMLPCEAYGHPLPVIEWWLLRPLKLIGIYEPLNNKVIMKWSLNGTYRIVPGGNLVIDNAKRAVIERYKCIASSSKGNVSAVVHFRLDYSDWYRFELFHSVFWGSVIASFFACAISFVLNILWIISRKTILWWIKRAERLSRVRNMIEACEKYRQRQMVNLHDTYHKRMNHIRENYHQQVEQLCSSYSSQAERFRGYRAAQMESMNQHLDNIRENYNQQISRLRDFGSRRAEQLWESYERQMNRVRTFSLQQRLRLMRQYKVKQRYINKLLQKFNYDSAETAFMQPHSEATVLGPMQELEAEEPLSRSSSYYSLPEYVLDDEGEAHCPPRADIPSHMFNRHSQALSGRNHFDDVPGTSKTQRQKKPRGDSTISTCSSLSAFPRRRFSLLDQSVRSTDTDTPSTSKMDDLL